MTGWLARLAARRDAGPHGGIELPRGARLERDLAYGSDPAQRLDLYLPADPAAQPALAVVGGGAWSLGDKAAPETVRDKVAHWVPRGHAVASIGYRRLPQAGPLEQAHDVARALGFLQRRLAAGDAPAPVVLVGHSSGAHLVALLAADMEAAGTQGAKPWLGSVLVDSAALDVVELMSGPHLPLHDRAFGAAPEGWLQASPRHRLRGRTAPMLLVHSSRRALAGEMARAFAGAVADAGGRADVLAVDLSHAELNAQLGRDAAYTQGVDAFLRTLDAGADRVSAAEPS